MKKLLFLLVFACIGTGAAKAQWTAQTTSLAAAEKISTISVVNANTAWAHSGLAVLRTLNGGNTWQTIPIYFTAPNGMSSYRVQSIHGVDATTAYMVTMAYAGHANYIRIYKTSDGGQNWRWQNTAYPNEYRQGTISIADFVHFFNPNEGLIFGDQDSGYFEIYTTANGGQAWNRIPATNLPASTLNDLSVPGRLYDVHGDTIWVGVRGMRVLKSTDKGQHWTVSATGIAPVSGDYEAIVKGIAFSDSRNGLVTYTGTTTSTTILKRTTDGGLTWATVNYSGPVGKMDLEAIPGIPGAYISTSGGMYGTGSSITYDHGDTWTSLDNTLKHYDIEFLNKTTGWTTSDGVLYKFSGSPLGTGEKTAAASGFTIAPNPGNGTFFVTNPAPGSFVLEVYNLTGARVLQQQGNRFGTTRINLSGQPQGVYLVRIHSRGQVFNQKLVLQ